MDFIFHVSRVNIASSNIANFLPYQKKVWDVDVIFIEPLVGKNVVLSSHKSEKGIPAFTVHVPGNWAYAELGGEEFKLSVAMPSFMYSVLFYFKEVVDERGFDVEVSYESDHHGPSSDYPISFVELGSSEKDWKDLDKAEAVAEAVVRAVEKPKKAKEVFVGIGGGHYHKKFVKLSFEEGLAFAHLMPKYRVDEIEDLDSMLRQSVEKSVERVKGFVVEKKGLSGKQRKKVLDALDRLSFEWFFV